MHYSIIIVTYHRHGPLCDTLRVLASLVDPANGELLVIDQCPTGDLPDDVLSVPGLRYVTPNRPGHVAARNSGVRLAHGDVLLFLDDDVIPLPGLIDGHLEAYRDPTVGAVAGRILEPGQTVTPPPHPKLFHPVDGWLYAHFDHAVEGDVMTARGCNMSFRRDLLIELGGFDMGLAPHPAFREETDMCMRVRAAGYRVRFVPAAALVHLNAPSGGTRDAKPPVTPVRAELARYHSLYRHQFNHLYFVLKHFRDGVRSVNVWRAYRDYVGISRWPWRVVGKNLAFFLALWAAAWSVRRNARQSTRLSG